MNEHQVAATTTTVLVLVLLSHTQAIANQIKPEFNCTHGTVWRTFNLENFISTADIMTVTNNTKEYCDAACTSKHHIGHSVMDNNVIVVNWHVTDWTVIEDFHVQFCISEWNKYPYPFETQYTIQHLSNLQHDSITSVEMTCAYQGPDVELEIIVSHGDSSASTPACFGSTPPFQVPYYPDAPDKTMQAASSKMQNEIAPLPSHTTQTLVESGDSTAVGSQIGHPTNGSIIAIVLVCLTIFIGSVASIVVVYLRRKKTKASHQTAVTSDDTNMSDLNNKTSHTRDIEHNTSHQYEQTKLDSFTTGSDKQTSESDKWSLNVQTEYSTASKPQAKDYHLSPLQNDYGHVKTENNFPRSSLQNGYDVSQWHNKCQTPMSKIEYQAARKQHYSLLSSLQTGCQMPSLQNKWQPSMSQNEFTASPWQKEGQLSDYEATLPQQQNQPSSLQNESEAKPWQKESQLSDYPVARPHQQTPPSLSPKFNEYRTPSWQHGCKQSNDTPVFPSQQICQRSNHGETSLPPFFQDFTKMINSSSNNRHIHLQSVGQNDDFTHAQVFDNEFAETADNKEFYQTDKTYLAKEKLIYTDRHGSM